MTTFISYSRVNSAFVVRLAKDLKAAGFDVWLDQLDIPKGARWDDEIEAAVERSTTFMIVLAPESIESQNVKDELSYAIDSGKQILPVIIRPCKIPLRLRRFQYVDFTDKPYKDSLADIKHLLSNTARLSKVTEELPFDDRPAPVAVIQGPLLRRDMEMESESPETEERVYGKGIRRFIVPVLLALVAIAAIGVAVVYAANRDSAPSAASVTDTLNPPTITATASLTMTPLPSQIIDSHSVTMRLVPAGNFIMGSDSGLPDEKPVQTVSLDTFYIDKYEVTNAQYKACVDAGACDPPMKSSSVTRVHYYTKADFDNFPVVFVDWNMAKSYCAWRGARLPTEAEWEKAARGTDGRTYPWGEDISCEQANYFGCKGDTVSVSSYDTGQSVYGVFDMAGNVEEWVSTLYMPYPYNMNDGREDLNAPGHRVLRGGSWLNADNDNEVRASRRQMDDPSTAKDNIGFRCARTPDSSAMEMDPNMLMVTPGNSFTATSIAATVHVHRTRESENATAAATMGITLTPGRGPITITVTTNGATEPPVTNVPVVTDAPVTDVPVVTQPPVNNPTQPPVVNPTQPPVDNPTQPPPDNNTQPPPDNNTQPPDNNTQPPPDNNPPPPSNNVQPPPPDNNPTQPPTTP